MGSGKESLPLKIRLFVYLSHALSTWGDRMWSFGVGLFMVIISPESLRVTAVYGLSVGSAVLLFGALVGDWIDKTPRLKAARTTLVVQNTSVIVCALIIYTVITYKTKIVAVWPNEGLLIVCYVAIILVAIFSMLGSMGTSIAVQKDWIVEICGRDKDLLATMSATLRRIDLCNKLLAPIATGQIMHFASPGIGALFIAAWNLVSVFVEYILLWKVYILVPALRSKKLKYKEQDEKESAVEMVTLSGNQGNELDTEGEHVEVNNGVVNEKTDINEEKAASEQELDKARGDAKKGKKKSKDSVLLKMFSGLIILYRGWKTYIKYDVAFAGLGLAALYMTVLGFDNITVGFAYTQGINESVMGIVMAASALTGILGTFLYPAIRKRIGLERTGLFGFLFEVLFLCLCVASVWAPGSPFDPLYGNREKPVKLNMQCSLPGDNVTVVLNGTASGALYNLTDAGMYNDSLTNTGTNSSFIDEGLNMTGCEPQVTQDGAHSYISIWLLLAGIVGARCGLWMADLTITQLFLENVKETERGIVNGVQTSLNKLMDMLKFLMVIAAPDPHVFGILVLISFSFIILGWISYAKYSHGVRGHLFHFDKIRKCECGDATNNNCDPVDE